MTPCVTPKTVVTTTRSINDPSDVSGLDNNPTEVKHLGLRASQSELKKPRGWEVKHPRPRCTTESSCPWFSSSWMTDVFDFLARTVRSIFMVEPKITVHNSQSVQYAVYFHTTSTNKTFSISLCFVPAHFGACRHAGPQSNHHYIQSDLPAEPWSLSAVQKQLRYTMTMKQWLISQKAPPQRPYQQLNETFSVILFVSFEKRKRCSWCNRGEAQDSGDGVHC